MKKFILVSLILHSLILLVTMTTTPEKEKPELFEVTMAQGTKGQEKKSQPKDAADIIAMTPGPGEKKELKNFYWGLGFTSAEYVDYVDHVQYLIVEVNYPYEGYAGWEAGLLPGDKIYLVNGERISGTNDIRGDGPTDITLTILRGSANIIIHTKRCKVYY